MSRVHKPTATPTATHCPAVDIPNSSWNFCPNEGATYFFTIMFAALTIAHVVQAVLHRKAYCLVLIISAFLQFAAYVLRIVSMHEPANDGLWASWFVLILIAPIWTNAFVYMVMGRMVYNFLPSQELFKIRAWRFGLYFVLLDLVAFLVQAGGATTAAGRDKPKSTVVIGLRIYMAGVAFQQLFIFVFMYIAARFQVRVQRESTPDQERRGLRLLYILYVVLFLITMRIVFRLIEYSKGADTSLPNHEVYMFGLDTAPMFLAILLFNLVHPGRIMPGKQSDFPSRKERRRKAKEAILDPDALQPALPKTKNGDYEMVYPVDHA